MHSMDWAQTTIYTFKNLPHFLHPNNLIVITNCVIKRNFSEILRANVLIILNFKINVINEIIYLRYDNIR